MIKQTHKIMKSLSKILLAAVLLAGTGYTYANPALTVKLTNRDDVQDRHLSGFHAVDVSGSYDVYITQGGSESVKVDAPSDMMDHVVTEVENGVLKIYNKHESGWNWNGSGSHKIKVYVTAKSLNALGVSGSGDAYFKDGLTSDEMKISVSGSGDVSGKIEVKTLDCHISGSGDMKLSGHAENSNVSVSGSGDYNGKEVATVSTAVHVSGSGDASINASTNIEASVSGSGDVSYTGGATNIVKSKSGSGDISKG